MTKKEMIKAIQKKEAELWLEFNSMKEVFGENNNITLRSRREWNSIFSLMSELGIESDHTLEESKEAMNLCLNFWGVNN